MQACEHPPPEKHRNAQAHNCTHTQRDTPHPAEEIEESYWVGLRVSMLGPENCSMGETLPQMIVAPPAGGKAEAVGELREEPTKVLVTYVIPLESGNPVMSQACPP